MLTCPKCKENSLDTSGLPILHEKNQGTLPPRNKEKHYCGIAVCKCGFSTWACNLDDDGNPIDENTYPKEQNA